MLLLGHLKPTCQPVWNRWDIY